MALNFFRLLVICSFGLFASATYAQQVLTVTNSKLMLSLDFSLQELLEFEQVEIVTANEFVDGKRRFVGPLARDVLELVGGNETSVVTLTAANDYQVEFSAAEFYEFDVILALKMDDVSLSRRDKGPIWVIYPTSDFAKLRDPVFNSRLIWQLVRLDLQ